MEKAKKKKYCKRLIYKQFYKSQVYVAHSFRVICRNISRTIVDFVWRRHICVQSIGTQIWPPEIMINDNINIWSSLFL